MFPNLRLMIVAVLASILGISCALGLFAEFRVSHDSFLRESNASAPLQLSSGEATPGRLVNTAAPFEFHFQAPAQLSPAGPPAPDQSETSTVSATTTSAPAAASKAGAATSPTALPVASDQAAEAPSSVAMGSIANQSTQRQAPQNGPQNTEPVANNDVATPATSPAAGTTVPNIIITPARAQTPAPEKRKRTTLRRRPIIVRRVQRTWPALSMQDFTGSQSYFQWATQPTFPSPPPVRRRIIRRARPVQKPVVQSTTPPTAVSTTTPADTPE